MNWSSVEKNLPNQIQLYYGHDINIPIKAWAVVVPIDKKKKNKFKIFVSSDVDGLETPDSFAKNNNAIIVINGGYFSKGKAPIHHVGLLKYNGFLKEPASKTVIRNDIRYPINRAAIGIDDDNNIAIRWASTNNDSIFFWKNPNQNRPGRPSELDYSKSTYWDVYEALHAGPMIINDGAIEITSEQEVFFNTPIDGVQPRSAIGYTKNSEIIIMVIDGRQVDSRGAYLSELAILMLQFNCVQAMNLDGGGSSALIVNGDLINKPIGLNNQREVMSSIGVISE